MINFLQWIRNYFLEYPKEEQLDINFKLAGLLLEAESRLSILCIDYEIELVENRESQLQADIFQQALTNTFTEKRIQDFFDEADRLREEHDNAK